MHGPMNVKWVEPNLLSPECLHSMAQRQFTLVSCTLIKPTFRKEFNYCNHRKFVVLEITGINLECNIRSASLSGSDGKGGS